MIPIPKIILGTPPTPLKKQILGRQKGKWAVGFWYGFETLHGLLTNKNMRIPMKNRQKADFGWTKGEMGCYRGPKHQIMVGGDALRLLCRNVRPENFHSRRWGAELRVSCPQTWERGPPSLLLKPHKILTLS